MWLAVALLASATTPGVGSFDRHGTVPFEVLQTLSRDEQTATNYLRTGRYAEARTIIDRLLSKSTKNLAMLKARCDVARCTNQLEPFIARLERVVANDRKSGYQQYGKEESWFQLAIAYGWMRRSEESSPGRGALGDVGAEAVERFRASAGQAAEHAATNWLGLRPLPVLLALAEETGANPALARQLLVGYLKDNPRSLPARAALCDSYSRGPTPSTKAFYYDDKGRVVDVVIRDEERMRPDLLRTLAEETKRLFPQWPSYDYFMGIAHHAKGKPALAAASLTKFLKLTGTPLEFQQNAKAYIAKPSWRSLNLRY